jgi:hypothetical protein
VIFLIVFLRNLEAKKIKFFAKLEKKFIIWQNIVPKENNNFHGLTKKIIQALNTL